LSLPAVYSLFKPGSKKLTKKIIGLSKGILGFPRDYPTTGLAKV
jgi:hypothetical protein